MYCFLNINRQCAFDIISWVHIIITIIHNIIITQAWYTGIQQILDILTNHVN